ncbi:glycosyltransferase family protein [Muricoccus radiodurans]|uniref:glycosyltransferase family protein n=1 Tax=Muricoccus radiodurans TaxID=2231721 RepID=UPI003CEB05E9
MSDLIERPATPAMGLGAAPPVTGHVVAVIGQNENGILRESASRFMELLRPLGVAGHVLDLFRPDWPATLDALLQERVLFAWGPAGVGAHLPLEGGNLWDALRVPFISVLADHPCIMPRNHHVPALHVANGYMVPDWLAVQRSLIRAPQLSGILPLGVLPNPHRDAIPWRDRPHRMVFVKTGSDPEAWRRRWADFPARIRAVLEESSEAALHGWPREVTEAVSEAAEGQGLWLEGRPEALFGLCYEVDTYVRDVRSTALARALLHLPAVIHGRGWEHLAGQATRARFLPALDAALLPTLYAESGFVLNTSPNFTRGIHERVVNGFASGACVVSDANPVMEERFSGLPSFFGVDVMDPDLPDRLAALFHDTTDRGDAVRPAAELAARDFDAMGFMQGLIGMAHEIRLLSGFEAFLA